MLRHSRTQFCPNLEETDSDKNIYAAFSVWQSVGGLSFQKVSSSEDCEIKLFLADHDNKIDCSYELNGQKRGTLAHAFFQVQDKSVEIFALTMNILQIKKQNLGMVNIIYFLEPHMNQVMLWEFSTPMKRCCDGIFSQTWLFN